MHVRVALVHDWLLTLGGADRVLLALHQMFPQAPVYTALHDPRRMPPAFASLPIARDALRLCLVRSARLQSSTRIHAGIDALLRNSPAGFLIDDLVLADPSKDDGVAFPVKSEPIASRHATFPSELGSTLNPLDAKGRMMWILNEQSQLLLRLRTDSLRKVLKVFLEGPGIEDLHRRLRLRARISALPELNGPVIRSVAMSSSASSSFLCHSFFQYHA